MTVAASELVDTIVTLADELARLCPEGADRAKQIIALAGELRGAALDSAAVRDAIEAETADSEISDAKVRNTAAAVLRAACDEPGEAT